MMNDQNGFSSPPGAAGGQQQSADDEQAFDQFAVPGDAGESMEAASVSAVPESLGGIDMRLLEIKRGIEDGMLAALAQSAGARAADAFSDGGNIQGVAISLGSGGADLGRARPACADAVCRRADLG